MCPIASLIGVKPGEATAKRHGLDTNQAGDTVLFQGNDLLQELALHVVS